MKKYYQFFIVFLFGWYGLELTVEGKLNYYINTKYIILTGITSTICVVIGLIGIILLLIQELRFMRKQIKGIKIADQKNYTLISIVSFIPLVAALCFGFFMEPKPLSTDASAQTISGNFHLSSGNIKTVTSKLGSDTTKYTFDNWFHINEIDTNYSFEKGKKVILTGYIFHPKNINPPQEYLAELLITCCTVDAQPFGYPIIISSNKNFNDKQWVMITGHFAIKKNDNRDFLYIVTDSIFPTMQPDNPYIYY